MMPEMLLILASSVGMIIGGVVVYLANRPRLQRCQHDRDLFSQALDKSREDLTIAQRDKAVALARLQEVEKKSTEQVALVEDARNRLRLEFENLANALFDKKSEQNRQGLDTILKPLRERLADFQKQVQDAYVAESKERFSLAREVQRLAQLNQQVSKDTEALTSALKGQAKTRGDWGEVILSRVLEASGLEEGREYQTQESFRDAEGSLLRPDVIIRLPDERDVVIDSKVPLIHYERYCNCESDEDRGAAARDFLASVQAHLKGLQGKNYEGLPQLRSLDFVLMFVPIEGAFLTALQLDPDLFRRGFEQNVMIVSPSTLLFCLRIIQNIWRSEWQSRHAVEIAERGGLLHDKFVGFVEDLLAVGTQIDRAKETWETAKGKLSTGRGNLVRQSQQLADLGAKAKKKLPPSVTAGLDQDEEEPLLERGLRQGDETP